MTSYPVHYVVEKPRTFTRLALVIRLLAFVVLGMLGLSLGAVFVALYVALPVFAAARLAAGRDPADYFAEEGRLLTRALRWFGAIYGWFGFVVDRLPLRAPEEQVRVEIQPMGQPTPASALWRLLVGLPSALVLAVLGFLGGFVWLWAALETLIHERVADGAFSYLAGLQRWGVRLLAYQASLVDVYPPFSFEDAERALPAARAT